MNDAYEINRYVNSVEFEVKLVLKNDSISSS